MKKLLMTGVIACVAGWSSAGIVAYWDGDQGFDAAGKPPAWQDTSLVSATLGPRGVSAHNWSGKGSTDGTFGTVGSPAAPDNSLAWQIKTGEFQTFSVTNASAADLQLDSIHFDYAHIFGALTVNLSYANGDLTDADGTSLGSHSTTGQVASLSDWEDADVALSGFLTDRVLAAGQTAVFRFDFVGGTAGLDNIAIGASAIPEPATLGLVVLMSGGLLVVRRVFIL